MNDVSCFIGKGFGGPLIFFDRGLRVYCIVLKVSQEYVWLCSEMVMHEGVAARGRGFDVGASGNLLI